MASWLVTCASPCPQRHRWAHLVTLQLSAVAAYHPALFAATVDRQTAIVHHSQADRCYTHPAFALRAIRRHGHQVTQLTKPHQMVDAVQHVLRAERPLALRINGRHAQVARGQHVCASASCLDVWSKADKERSAALPVCTKCDWSMSGLGSKELGRPETVT